MRLILLIHTAVAVSWRRDHARFAYLRELKQLSVSTFLPRGRQASPLGNPRAFRSLRYYSAIILRRYNEERAVASQKRRRDKENDADERDARKVEKRVT